MCFFIICILILKRCSIRVPFLLKNPLENSSIDFCFKFSTSARSVSPDANSLTYISFWICWKCYFSVLSNINGDWVSPNSNLVNPLISTILGQGILSNEILANFSQVLWCGFARRPFACLHATWWVSFKIALRCHKKNSADIHLRRRYFYLLWETHHRLS